MNLTTAPTGGGRRTVRRAAALASTLLLAAGGLAVSAAAPASAAPTSFPATSGVPAFIGDYTTSNAGIPVSSATSSAITAQITLNHSCVADLVISLIAPDGTTAVLADENRTCRGLNGTYTFSDSGADSFLSAPTTSSYEIPGGQYRASNSRGVVDLAQAFAGVDPDGQWTIRVADEAGLDTGTLSSASLTFGTDMTDAPTVVVDGGPADGATVTSAPTYTFYVPEQGSTTKECRVDEGAWVDCTSPYTVDISELEDGPHTVDFRARAESGLQGQSVRRTFVLDAVPDEPADTTAPVVTISSGPTDGASVESAPTFTFTSADDDVAGYECSVDGAAFAACTSPVTLTTEPGAHTFAVRATDESGNTGTAVTRSFTQRDLACEEATATLAEAKADLREAKARFARAKESGNKTRIERTRALRNEARAERNEALAQVEQEC
ncbi:hypothetical protein GCM10009719_38080 [Nocardioides kribbensis]